MAVGDIFLCTPPHPPTPPRPAVSLRPIMLYQIPWPFEQSRRWIPYMPLLNVNNHSLTSTSECDTHSVADVYTLTCCRTLPFIAVSSCCLRFVGRINIYKEKDEPVARWVFTLLFYMYILMLRSGSLCPIYRIVL